MTSRHDVITLGTWLDCDRHQIHRIMNDFRHSIQDASYEILMATDRRLDEVERWTKVIEAFKQMENNRAIQELGLEKLLDAVKTKKQTQEGW